MKSKRNHIDVFILIGVLALMVLSIGTVYSASSTWALERTGNPGKLMTNHVISVVAAIITMFIFMNIPYHIFKKLSKFTIAGAVMLLAATLIVGSEIKGATRWIQMGPFSFQPSEFARFALLLHVCVLLDRKKNYLDDWQRSLIPISLWVGIIALLIMIQPNFSMAAMVIVLSFIVLFLGRVPIRHLFAGGLLMLPATAIYFFSADYRMKRLTEFFSGSGGTSDTAYQMTQGIIAFGSGGIFGVGPGASRQRDFFLPESYGDYIFAIFGEEYGFIGAAIVLIIFTIIFIRGMKIALHVDNDFGRYAAGAITVAVCGFAIINSLVTTGLIPTTGLPMPFLSYGGTAMVMNAAAMGILLNISSHTNLHPKGENATPTIELNRVQ